MVRFEDLGLSQNVLKAINNMGFEEATPIQGQSIPVALDGKDLIGQAQTGTGKTTAFGVPMIEKIDAHSNAIQGIIIAPTRELAMQVAEEMNKIGQFSRIKTLPIYGGQDIRRQMKALKNGPNIIAATPGRLIDHIKRKTIKLSEIKVVVLDEADEMLNMGFIDDIKEILKEVPDERQTMLFSATMPREIQLLAQNFMKNPEVIRVKTKEVTVPNIEQRYIELREQQKFDVLTRLLDIQSPELAIVFGRTKRRVDELSEALGKRGYLAEGIHGDLSQAQRDKVLRNFKSSKIDVLVATDVAARGLDISGVTHVYNFDLPQDPEGYVHRVGRTGRAGQTGMAVSFVTYRETDHLKSIERTTKHQMVKMQAPSLHEAIEGQQKMATDSLINAVKQEDIGKYKNSAERILEDHDAVDLIAAALKLLTKEPDETPVKLTAEAPLRVRKDRNNNNNSKNHKHRRPFPPKHRTHSRKSGHGQNRGKSNNGGGNKNYSNSNSNSK